VVFSTDLERRYPYRFLYYPRSGRSLTSDPAYVGALQTALARLGYYCGEPDGIFSDEVSDAIARLQKNHSMRVTGRLSIAVRRALFLP
jgi:peptidoglycan hydrolase-like protein with peptidoglycan-binding domain